MGNCLFTLFGKIAVDLSVDNKAVNRRIIDTAKECVDSGDIKRLDATHNIYKHFCNKNKWCYGFTEVHIYCIETGSWDVLIHFTNIARNVYELLDLVHVTCRHGGTVALFEHVYSRLEATGVLTSVINTYIENEAKMNGRDDILHRLKRL